MISFGLNKVTTTINIILSTIFLLANSCNCLLKESNEIRKKIREINFNFDMKAASREDQLSKKIHVIDYLGELTKNVCELKQIELVHKLKNILESEWAIYKAYENILIEMENSDKKYAEAEAFKQLQNSYEICSKAVSVLSKIGFSNEGLLPIYIDFLRSKSKAVQEVAASVVARIGTKSFDHLLFDAFSIMSDEEVIAYYRTALPAFWKEYPEFKKLAPSDRSVTRELAMKFALEHENPRVRAISLSFAIVVGRNGENYEFDFNLLKKIFSSDKSLIVRRAAVRIAGYIGESSDNLNLKEIVLRESNILLLRDAIESRSLWATRYRYESTGFQIFDGLMCNWIPRRQWIGEDWSNEEIQRLEKLLKTENDQKLRDSISMVLAERERGNLGYLGYQYNLTNSTRNLRLIVHEWGVWEEDNNCLKPHDREITNLPWFVHKSLVSADELWVNRSYKPMAVRKPVVFFYAQQPMAILFKVSYNNGRPWAYYPDATDYLESTSFVSYNKERDDEKYQNFSDREQFSPPWNKPVQNTKKSLMHENHFIDETMIPDKRLFSKYRLAPWLLEGNLKNSQLKGQGKIQFTGIGLEWCGLRLGYSEDLEVNLKRIDEKHFWSNLRNVPSTPVSIRGEREKFLFYDGSTGLKSPIQVSWADNTRNILNIRCLNNFKYPEISESVQVYWSNDRSRNNIEKNGKYFDYTLLPVVFIIKKEESYIARGKVIEHLDSENVVFPISLNDFNLDSQSLRQKLLEIVITQGLTDKEAEALIEIWGADFFEKDGLRVITIVPRWFYDACLPIEVWPVPYELVRVGLILKECENLKVDN